MSLHRINSVTIGVPDVEKTSEFYRDFGITEVAPGCSPPLTAASSCA